jgi:hypothetical protein
MITDVNTWAGFGSCWVSPPMIQNTNGSDLGINDSADIHEGFLASIPAFSECGDLATERLFD